MDLTIAKAFTLRGTSQIQFRFESFNVFNWRQYNNPNTTVTSPTFGQITSVALDENGADRAATDVLKLKVRGFQSQLCTGHTGG